MIWDKDISFEGLYKKVDEWYDCTKLNDRWAERCSKLNDKWAEQYNELNKKLVDICQKIREEKKDD